MAQTQFDNMDASEQIRRLHLLQTENGDENIKKILAEGFSLGTDKTGALTVLLKANGKTALDFIKECDPIFQKKEKYKKTRTLINFLGRQVHEIQKELTASFKKKKGLYYERRLLAEKVLRENNTLELSEKKIKEIVDATASEMVEEIKLQVIISSLAELDDDLFDWIADQDEAEHASFFKQFSKNDRELLASLSGIMSFRFFLGNLGGIRNTILFGPEDHSDLLTQLADAFSGSIARSLPEPPMLVQGNRVDAKINHAMVSLFWSNSLFHDPTKVTFMPAFFPFTKVAEMSKKRIQSLVNGDFESPVKAENKEPEKASVPVVEEKKEAFTFFYIRHKATGLYLGEKNPYDAMRPFSEYAEDFFRLGLEPEKDKEWLEETRKTFLEKFWKKDMTDARYISLLNPNKFRFAKALVTRSSYADRIEKNDRLSSEKKTELCREDSYPELEAVFIDGTAYPIQEMIHKVGPEQIEIYQNEQLEKTMKAKKSR